MLAFIEVWSPEQAERELPAIRAQLRGLGAELAIVAKDGAWLLGPDDPPLRLHEPATGDRSFELADGQMLVDALAAAAEAMRTPRADQFTRREWALTSLCAGFALALFGCKGKRKRRRQRPPPAAAPQAPPPPEYDIVLDVNGASAALQGRAARVAARRAARAARPDRHEEGLRPRPVRRVHRASSTAAA